MSNKIAVALQLLHDAFDRGIAYSWSEAQIRGLAREAQAELTKSMKDKDKLLNLLAVIHRDGGHYTEKHGLEKSYEDAMRLSAERLP